MTIPLSKELVETKQREIAGSRSSRQFAYQKNWALAELIKYHLAGKEYVFAFEFHDDVLILNSEDNPTNLEFVQVKTRTNGKNWTIKQLTNPVKGKHGNPDKLSIIGKLYENKFNFINHTSDLKFVTNAYFSFGNSLQVTCADTLNQDDQIFIASAMQSQLGSNSPIDLDNLYFEHSSLSIDDHEAHIRGKLHDFFDSLFGENHSISVSPWYQSISDQIKKKNDFPPEDVATFDELIRNKCITRSEIEDFIVKVNESRVTVESWDILKNQLFSEGYNYKLLIRLQKNWRKYATDRLDYDNTALKALEEKISYEILKHSSVFLSEKVDAIKSALLKDISKTSYLFDDDYITCIILWLDCEEL